MGSHFVFIYPQIKRLTGAQRLILALAGALTERGHKVTLLTHHFAAECRPALPEGVELVETGVNLNRTRNHYFNSLLEYGAVPSLLKRLPKHVTAVCFFGPPSLPGLWWAKHVRHMWQPLLYFCYEPPRAAYTDRREVSQRMGLVGRLVSPLFWLYRPIDRYLARQADSMLVNGEYGQELIQQTYGREATIITHGAELALPENLSEAAQAIRQRYDLGERPVLVTVNHLHPRKRVELLLQALPSIIEEAPETAALIVGQGPELENLKALAQQLNLSEKQVIFTGFAPDTELAAYYSAADVYVHTGRAETFGLSVLEAGRLGLPVVATNEGGPREIIVEGQSGFLVEATPTTLAEKIKWLLAHPTERQTMGQAAATRAEEKYSWAQGAQDFLTTI